MKNHEGSWYFAKDGEPAPGQVSSTVLLNYHFMRNFINI